MTALRKYSTLKKWNIFALYLSDFTTCCLLWMFTMYILYIHTQLPALKTKPTKPKKEWKRLISSAAKHSLAARLNIYQPALSKSYFPKREHFCVLLGWFHCTLVFNINESFVLARPLVLNVKILVQDIFAQIIFWKGQKLKILLFFMNSFFPSVPGYFIIVIS